MSPSTEKRTLAAKTEPFDSFWQGSKDVERDFSKFARFYDANYKGCLPEDKNAGTLVISCGPGHFVAFLNRRSFRNVLGIDSFADKVAHGTKRGLNVEVHEGFPFLEEKRAAGKTYDLIVGEQELNHLTKDEMVDFLRLCHDCLRPGGTLLVNGINGANPITGAEALSQNIDHFNTFTEYSFRQVLRLAGFDRIRVLPLNLYVFYKNPLNYVGLVVTGLLHLGFTILFKLYGKSNRIWSKKIAAVCRRPDA